MLRALFCFSASISSCLQCFLLLTPAKEQQNPPILHPRVGSFSAVIKQSFVPALQSTSDQTPLPAAAQYRASMTKIFSLFDFNYSASLQNLFQLYHSKSTG